MLIKKLLISLSILAAIGGTGLGVYHSLLKEESRELNVSDILGNETRRVSVTGEESQESPVPNVNSDNSVDNKPKLTVVKEAVSQNPINFVATLPVQRSVSSNERQLESDSVVNPSSKGEEISSAPGEIKEAVLENHDAKVKLAAGTDDAVINTEDSGNADADSNTNISESDDVDSSVDDNEHSVSGDESKKDESSELPTLVSSPEIN